MILMTATMPGGVTTIRWGTSACLACSALLERVQGTPRLQGLVEGLFLPLLPPAVSCRDSSLSEVVSLHSAVAAPHPWGETRAGAPQS